MASTIPPRAVVTEGIGKRFGEHWALRALDLEIRAGTVLGLLGPNGAGKTTAVRMLTTLLRPDEGRARVAGFDVVAEPQRVREHIGLAGQSATVDELLTGRANLEMVGRLYHLPRRYVRQRADELLERLELADAADRQARTYSGGMRRRLDLAASLLARPPVCFLDEPTTGLDPHSRNELWQVLRELVADGTTLLLTTQYLQEADQLCDEIVVVDHGRAVAQGSPEALKDQVRGERVTVTLVDRGQMWDAAAALSVLVGEPAQIDRERGQVIATVSTEISLLDIVRSLDAAGVEALDATRRRPTLDEVFLTLTGPAEARAPMEVAV
ncbi:MAG TPA: ATP-binding cassette domain-containing protein [Solirubrobacteraceae bacterium]|jgi:ABC-2 type transport system ATP-binding protein|nr:ATP-binding cassette domain-containing protein [Solirubrobacteraceae bacterium]